MTIEVPNREDISFKWAGPSLTPEFRVGDDVSYHMESEWRIVQSARTTAALLFGFSNTSLPRVPIPSGPTYTLEPQCVGVPDGSPCQWVATSWRMRASFEDESVAIDVGESATLGTWRLTNLMHTTSTHLGKPPGYACDPLNHFFIVALGPGRSP